MKWFLPAAKDEEQAIQVYQSIKDIVKSTDDRRIRRITYLENRVGRTRVAKVGKICVAEVGEIFPLNGEIVLAIFHGGSLYYVCTQNRLGGFIVGDHEVSSFEDFDAE